MNACQYTVRPFSGANYHDNADHHPEGTEPCAICGKPVKEPFKHQAVVVDGGGAWGDENSDAEDSGFMGWWPVGTDCHRRYRQPKEQKS